MMVQVHGVKDRARAAVKDPVREDPGQTHPVPEGAAVVPGGEVVAGNRERETGPGVEQGNNVRREHVMPGGDRTGPQGEGPMTGRGLGFCGSFAAPGYARGDVGWGRGYGAGGRGWRHMYRETGLPGWLRGGAPAVAPGVAQEWLETRARALESELAAIRTQLGELVRPGNREREGAAE